MNKIGIIYALMAYSLWGLSALYWKLISYISPTEIIAHRAFWAMPVLLIFLYAKKRLIKLKAAVNFKNFILLSFTAILVSVNWLVFVWAVNNGRLVEASFAYFIYPLAAVATGVILLGDKLNKPQVLALLLVLLAIILLSLDMGGVSWVVSVIILTFLAYTYIHKIDNLEPAVSLTLETILLLPFAIGYFIYIDSSASNGFSYFSQPKDWLVPLSGLMTALPLLWMITASKQLSLSTLGILFYLNPSLQLFIGVLIFDEPLSLFKLLCFGIIWVAIIIYTIFAPKKTIVI